jgi:vitamin K-dependent gamma-carboxylase-like protein
MRPARLTNVLIAAYVLFQLLYPIRGLVEDLFETWGVFTWNMYSQTYTCRVQYKLVDASGQVQKLEFQKYFVSRDRAVRVLHRDSLPQFNKFLCAQVAREGLSGRLLSGCSCTQSGINTETLVADDTDICHAGNFGVTR